MANQNNISFLYDKIKFQKYNNLAERINLIINELV